MALTSALNSVGFSLDTDGIKNKVRQITDKANEQRQEIRNFTTLTISLSSVWEGDAQKKFASTYQNALPIIGKIADLCDTLSASLQEYSDSVEAADKTAAARIRNCF